MKTRNNPPKTGLRTLSRKVLNNPPGVRFSLVMLALGCVLPLAAMATFLTFSYYDREQAQLHDTAIGRARAMASSVDNQFAAVEAALQALAISPSLQVDDIAGFYALARVALPNIGAEQILLFDASERMLFSTQRPFGQRLPDAATPPALKRLWASGKPGVSDLFLGRVVKHPVVVVTLPVRRSGSIVYFLNASFAPQMLAHVLTNQKMPDTWRATITDSTGSIAARTHGIDKLQGKKVVPALLDRMAVADEGAFGTVNLDGIPVLTVYSRSPLTRWTVVIGMPLAEITFGLRRTLTALIAATCAALAIALGLAFFIGGRIARSISALTAPAKALGSGAPLVIGQLHIREAVDVSNALEEAAAVLRKAQHASHHDNLTGMPNRELFQIVVEQQLELSIREATKLAILYIDLDGFKTVNDTQGHAAGDELLSAVAMRISHSIRNSDFAARLGGDEFAVALIRTSLEDAAAIAAKLIDAISQPYPLIQGRPLVSASIGISAYPASGTDADSLMKRADRAMYTAKALGKGRFSV